MSRKKQKQQRIRESSTIAYAGAIGVHAGDTQTLIERIEAGFPYGAFESLLTLLDLTPTDLADLVQIPRRTLTRRKRAGRFTPDESERLLRLSRVLDTAVELFEGEHQRAMKWLRSPNRALNHETPLDMARTEVGAHAVEDLIGRLEHGVFS